LFEHFQIPVALLLLEANATALLEAFQRLDAFVRSSDTRQRGAERELRRPVRRIDGERPLRGLDCLLISTSPQVNLRNAREGLGVLRIDEESRQQFRQRIVMVPEL